MSQTWTPDLLKWDMDFVSHHSVLWYFLTQPGLIRSLIIEVAWLWVGTMLESKYTLKSVEVINLHEVCVTVVLHAFLVITTTQHG